MHPTPSHPEHDLAPARLLLATLHPDLRALGAQWWHIVGERCALWARETAHSTPQAAAALALLSPNRTWPANVTLAKAALYSHGAHIRGFPHQAAQLRALLALDPQQATADRVAACITGPKVTNMYGSTLGQDACCIDRHIYAIWNKRPSARNYALVEAHVRALAADQGQTARATQATLWLAKVAHDGRRLDLYHPGKDTPTP